MNDTNFMASPEERARIAADYVVMEKMWARMARTEIITMPVCVANAH